MACDSVAIRGVGRDCASKSGRASISHSSNPCASLRRPATACTVWHSLPSFADRRATPVASRADPEASLDRIVSPEKIRSSSVPRKVKAQRGLWDRLFYEAERRKQVKEYVSVAPPKRKCQ